MATKAFYELISKLTNNDVDFIEKIFVDKSYDRFKLNDLKSVLKHFKNSNRKILLSGSKSDLIKQLQTIYSDVLEESLVSNLKDSMDSSSSKMTLTKKPSTNDTTRMTSNKRPHAPQSPSSSEDDEDDEDDSEDETERNVIRACVATYSAISTHQSYPKQFPDVDLSLTSNQRYTTQQLSIFNELIRTGFSNEQAVYGIKTCSDGTTRDVIFEDVMVAIISMKEENEYKAQIDQTIMNSESERDLIQIRKRQREEELQSDCHIDIISVPEFSSSLLVHGDTNIYVDKNGLIDTSSGTSSVPFTGCKSILTLISVCTELVHWNNNAMRSSLSDLPIHNQLQAQSKKILQSQTQISTDSKQIHISSSSTITQSLSRPLPYPNTTYSSAIKTSSTLLHPQLLVPSNLQQTILSNSTCNINHIKEIHKIITKLLSLECKSYKWWGDKCKGYIIQVSQRLDKIILIEPFLGFLYELQVFNPSLSLYKCVTAVPVRLPTTTSHNSYSHVSTATSKCISNGSTTNTSILNSSITSSSSLPSNIRSDAKLSSKIPFAESKRKNETSKFYQSSMSASSNKITSLHDRIFRYILESQIYQLIEEEMKSLEAAVYAMPSVAGRIPQPFLDADPKGNKDISCYTLEDDGLIIIDEED